MTQWGPSRHERDPWVVGACGCFGDEELLQRDRERRSRPAGPTLELARALAGRHDQVRFMHRASGRYKIVRPFPKRREPGNPWAPYLADHSARYRSVGLDLDTRPDTGEGITDSWVRSMRKGDRDAVMRDLHTIVRLSREAGLWFLPEQSHVTGGIHVWWPSAERLHPAVVADMALRLAVVCPTLDVSPLVNPATGTLRTPGTPHLLGGRSRILGNYLDVDSVDIVGRVREGNPPEAFLALRAHLPPRPSDDEVAEVILPRGSFSPSVRRLGNPAALLAVRAFRSAADANVIAGSLKAHHWVALQPLYDWAERLGALEFFRPYEGIAWEAARSSGWTYTTLQSLVGTYVDVVQPGLRDGHTATIWGLLPPPGLAEPRPPLFLAEDGLQSADGRFRGEVSRGQPGQGGVRAPDTWDLGPEPRRLDHRSPAFRDGGNTCRVALALLEGAPLTQEEIRIRTGMSTSSVSWALRRLEASGLVVVSERRYSLTSAAFDCTEPGEAVGGRKGRVHPNLMHPGREGTRRGRRLSDVLSRQ